MFENKTYKRFKKIYKYFKQKDKMRIPFNTKLGERDVICCEIPKDWKVVLPSTDNDAFEIKLPKQDYILFNYLDYDSSILFSLLIFKNGQVKIIKHSIDEVAIYSAIYEIECLIYGEKKKCKGETLKKLLSYYDNNTNTMGLMRWR